MEYNYKNPLSVTSQFSFCGLPFRMDTYSGCAFGCSYCFARLRGGNIDSKKLKAADPNLIISRFQNALNNTSDTQSMITEYILRGVPVHFGGMSDPFQSIERKVQSSLKVLEYLSTINYPIVISTKSTLVSEEPYLGLLKNYPNVVVQFSFSTLDEDLTKIIEPNVALPSKLLETIELLSKNGVKTSIRWQPYIPTVSETPESFISKITQTGARHIGFEHLKLPLEKNNRINEQILTLKGIDLKRYYEDNKSKHDGRELILTSEKKIETILKVKELAHRSKLTFGAADNEFQYLSDTSCCCSGVDQFKGFENWNKFQISNAVKKSFDKKSKEIRFETIANEWKPTGSIDKHLNSKTRLNNSITPNTVNKYILDRWENLKSPFNPTNFYGVKFNGQHDNNGLKIYNLDEEIIK